MALSDLSFKLYSDSGLTTLYGGTTNLQHKVNLSDNPQTFTLYFGSASTSNRSCKALSNPDVDQIVLTPTLSMPVWAVATAYVVGDLVTPTVLNGKNYRCTVAGTSHAATEPTWPTVTLGTTVTDGTVTWELYSVTHPITEIKMAITEGGLTAAVAGAALSIGTSVTNGSGNAIPIWVRVTNSVTNLSNNTVDPELKIFPNSLVEQSF